MNALCVQDVKAPAFVFKTKARRTGPAVPQSIAFAACPQAPSWMPAMRPPDDVGSTMRPSDGVGGKGYHHHDTWPAQHLLAQVKQQQQPQHQKNYNMQQQQLAQQAAFPGATWAAPSPDAWPSVSDQLQLNTYATCSAGDVGNTSTGVAASSQSIYRIAPQRKSVRFAPGPLAMSSSSSSLDSSASSTAEAETSCAAAVSPDGHPAGEGRVAMPVRRLPATGSTLVDLSQINIKELEELLGPENAPSLARLKRRVSISCGLLAAVRPPRVQLTTAVQHAQRQQT